MRFCYRSLVPLFRHIGRRGRRFDHHALIAAYLDESGGPPRSPVLCVAIVVAREDGWDAFERGWRPHLETLKRPYHAKNCTRLNAPLCDLMDRHMDFASFINVPVAEFHRSVPKWVQSALGGPYRFGVQSSILSAARWAKMNELGRLSYFIEQGHQEFQFVMELMNRINQHEMLRELFHMETWGPATKSDMPVHTADAVSHEAMDNYGKENWGPFIEKLRSNELLLAGTVTPETIQTYSDSAKLVVKQLRRDNEQTKWLMKQARLVLKRDDDLTS